MNRPDARTESGLTLIEVLVTVLVLTVGLLVTLSVFSEMGRATYVAQRKAVLISMAQRDMERVRVLPYEQIGLSRALPANAPGRCRANQTCASEPLVSGGVIDPGPDTFKVQGVTGKIYRYVTWRTQACPVLNARVAGELSTDWGHTATDIRAAIGDLCPGTEHTKRITIVVSSAEVLKKFGGPVRLSTVASDPDSTVLAAGNYDGLKVEARPAVSPAGGTTAYDAMTSQTFNLTDTRCSQSSRQAPGGGHDSHDTSRDGNDAVAGAQPAPCAAASGPDLMSADAITGQVSDPLPDLSREVTRAAVGGRVLARDDRAGACDQLAYTDGDAGRRKRSVHTWATGAPAAPWETPTSGGRATLTFWTQTASARPLPGRLCATVWRDGQVLGTADYSLPSWPDSPTQLAISMDLERAVAAAGSRLLVTLRTPSDSAADLLLLYDHPGYQTSLTVTTKQGAEIR